MKNNNINLKIQIKNYINKFNIGTKTMFKEFFNSKTNIKQRANMLTFLRLITPIITIIFSIIGLITNIKLFFIISGFIALLGASTDFFDGKCARKYNCVSEYGKQLDQITDKLFSILISFNLVIINTLFLLPILGEIMIGLTNLYYKLNYNNLELKSTYIGKLKEWPLFLLLGIGYFIPVSKFCNNMVNILLPITSIMQICTAISYIYNNNIEINTKKIVKNNK